MKKSILNTEVSFFPDLMKPKPQGKVNLLDWLTKDTYMGLVTKIRNAKDKGSKSALKRKLPAITPSGVFSIRRDDALIRHSGLLCIDIDSEGNEWIGSIPKLKSYFSKVKEVAYCGVSVSGNGLFLLIPISFITSHRKHFRYISWFLSNEFRQIALKNGIELPDDWTFIDQSCKNESRLRFASWDPNPYINHQALPLMKYENDSLLFSNKPQSTSRAPLADFSRSNIENCVAQIELSRIDITKDYDAWIQIGSALVNELGENGRAYYHTISKFYPKYNAKETDLKYTSLLKRPTGHTIGTFFYHCSQNGIQFKGSIQT